MTVGLDVEWLDRTPSDETPEAAGAAGVGGVAPISTRDPTCCLGQVALEARQ